jgi:6-phosphogluconolactonase
MPYYLYIALQDDDKIAIFTMDGDTGQLAPKSEVAVPGGPSLLAISSDHNVLYAGHRTAPGISSYRIDPSSGGLTQHGVVELEGPPAYLATDRTGRYLLYASYQGGYVAVHPIGDDGGVGGPAVESLETANGAHAILTDRSNRFAFVPHIARFNDNVLEPIKESYGPNVIYQFKFDEHTVHLTPNSPPQVEQEGRLGPRHLCFHPTQDIVYFSNEQGCSVTGYRIDSATGTLSAFQTITTQPGGYAERNTCSQIQLSPSGNFLYVPNRGHNSIASFSVDATTGQLKAVGHASTEAVPSAFSLDPEGKFVFAAGSASGRIASYRIHGETGELTPLETYDVGKRPMWVLVARLGDA